MKEISQKLLIVASISLCAAGAILLCLSLLGYQNTLILPAALGCVALSMLFQIIFRQVNK